MGLTHYPNGISSFGVPVLGSGPIFTTGNVYFVSSTATNSNDSTDHGTKEKPFATVDYAIGRTTANQGDYIIVMPGHNENLGSAGVTADVAGVSIVGIGHGQAKPTLNVTVTTGYMAISGASVLVENIRFIAGVADAVKCIDINAQDVTIRNCDIIEDTVDENFLIGVQAFANTGSERMVVEGCRFICPDAANTLGIDIKRNDGSVVRYNMMCGDWGTAAISAGAGAEDINILHNTIYNAASDTDAGINCNATADGLVAYNAVAGGAAQANGITTGACGAVENYYGVASEDLSAILEPIAT